MSRGLVRHLGIAALGCLAALVGSAATAPASGGDERKTVLLLYTEARLTPEFATAEEALRETLTAGPSVRVNYATYQLDVTIDADQRLDPDLAPVVRAAVRRLRADLVIVSRGAARFVMAQRGTIFSGRPLVLLGLHRRDLLSMRLEGAVTAVLVAPAWGPTLNVALHLHPDTERVVVLNGASVADREWAAHARADLASYASRVDITYLTGLPVDRIQTVLAQLPERTIVLVGPMLREGTDTRRTRSESIRTLLHQSIRPVYGLSESRLGEGIIGGYLWSARDYGVKIAEVALGILQGQWPFGQEVEVAAGGPIFDARQLKRWGISEAKLPAGSIVWFREPPVWQQPTPVLVSVGAVTLMIVAGVLLFQLTSRRRDVKFVHAHVPFERLLENVAADLGALPASGINHRIEGVLDQCVEALALDRATLVEFAADGSLVQFIGSRTGPEVEAGQGGFDPGGLPWTMERARRGETVAIASVDSLPAEATVDRATLLASRIRSLAAAPMQRDGTFIGVLCFGTIRAAQQFTDEFMRHMRLLAEILADAVARRRADAAAHEAGERFRAAADEAPVMIWMSDQDGKCIFLSKAWLAFTGRSVDDEIGEGWAEGVEPTDYRRCLDTYREALRSRIPFRMEYRLRRADGTYRWIADAGVPRYTPDGMFVGYVGSCADVTDVRSAQRVVEETAALRGAIFGALYGLIVALDRRGNVVAVNEGWNAAMEHRGGDPPRGAVGVNYLDVCRRAGEDPDARRALVAIESVLSGGALRASAEYRCVGPSGEQWFEMIVEPIRYPEGGVLVSHLDVTALHRAEQGVRHEREELAHALRLTAMGELVASVSHEINQPLSAIVTAAQATRRLLDQAKGSTVDTREALDDIIADAQRAAQVVRRVRAFLRKDHSERTRVDVNRLIEEVRRLVETDAGRRGVSVRLALAPQLSRVSADAIQIQQVLLNVIMNAIEATVDADEPREVTVESQWREPGILEIRVRDTGVGIDAEMLDKIFEPFVTTKTEGLGMGLSISRSIVQAHGGRIWGTRNPDRGLTVHIELPCEEAS